MISGRIHRIFGTQTIGDNFQKREFVLETGDNPQYPQLRKIEFTKDKCVMLDNFQVGQVVDVEVNLISSIIYVFMVNHDEWLSRVFLFKICICALGIIEAIEKK